MGLLLLRLCEGRHPEERAVISATRDAFGGGIPSERSESRDLLF
jgi:hypothetical protein